MCLHKSIGFVNKSLKSMNECTSEDCLLLLIVDFLDSTVLRETGVQADFDSSFPLRNIHLYAYAWMPATPWHCTALHYF